MDKQALPTMVSSSSSSSSIDYFGALYLAIMIAIMAILGYLFVELVKLSMRLNKVKYAIQKPKIPFNEPQTFDYAIETPAKSLL